MKNYVFLFMFLVVTFKGMSQNNWQILSSNTSLNLLDIQCSGEDTLFIFGEDGLLLKSTNGGQNFTSLQNGSASVYTAGFFTSLNEGFAADGGGNIKKTVNGGTSWTNSGGCSCFISSICFATNQIGLFGGLTGVFKTSDGGSSWSPSAILPFVNPKKIISLSNSVFLFADDDIVYKSTNLGTTFSTDTLNYGSNYSISGLSFPNNNVGFISTGDGIILKTVNQAGSWNVVGNAGTNVSEIVFTDAQNGYAITGSLGKNILQTTDGGQTWLPDFTSTETLTELAYDGHSIYAIGQNGMLLKKQAWTAATPTLAKTETHLFPNPVQNRLFVSGENFQNVAIFNSMGEQIFTGEVTNEKGIDVSHLAPGFYYVQLENKPSPYLVPFTKM